MLEELSRLWSELIEASSHLRRAISRGDESLVHECFDNLTSIGLDYDIVKENLEEVSTYSNNILFEGAISIYHNFILGLVESLKVTSMLVQDRVSDGLRSHKEDLLGDRSKLQELSSKLEKLKGDCMLRDDWKPLKQMIVDIIWSNQEWVWEVNWVVKGNLPTGDACRASLVSAPPPKMVEEFVWEDMVDVVGLRRDCSDHPDEDFSVSVSLLENVLEESEEVLCEVSQMIDDGKRVPPSDCGSSLQSSESQLQNSDAVQETSVSDTDGTLHLSAPQLVPVTPNANMEVASKGVVSSDGCASAGLPCQLFVEVDTMKLNVGEPPPPASWNCGLGLVYPAPSSRYSECHAEHRLLIDTSKVDNTSSKHQLVFIEDDTMSSLGKSVPLIEESMFPDVSWSHVDWVQSHMTDVKPYRRRCININQHANTSCSASRVELDNRKAGQDGCSLWYGTITNPSSDTQGAMFNHGFSPGTLVRVVSRQEFPSRWSLDDYGSVTGNTVVVISVTMQEQHSSHLNF